MKRVAAMALAEKQNEGLIFENRTGATVNNILPVDKTNEAFDKIDGNITGVEWEAETKIKKSTINMRHYQTRRKMKKQQEKYRSEQQWRNHRSATQRRNHRSG